MRSFSILPLIGFVFSFCFSQAAFSRERWTELNIGPFYVDTQTDTGAARDALNQFEQLRWVLGGLLESKDLPSVWPIRVLLVNSEKTNPNGFPNQFVSQNGQYILVAAPSRRLPLDQVAGILLEENTPRLPPEVESGLRQLFGTLEAHGSHVSWGGPPGHPDLDWARIRLLATKFEYGSSFHIFLNALRGGSGLRAAERNAFGKSDEALEQEAKADFASHDWKPVSVSGRPLDPKRDFGEHSVDDVIVRVYLADAELPTNPKSSEAAYKSAIEAGGAAAALGYAGLAQVAKLEKEDPKSFLDDAIRAGSRSAPVYVAAAEGLDADEALPLLKKAAQLNPLWAEPVYLQALLTSNLLEREALLKKATQLDPRATQYWIKLAETQTANGHASAAQGTWLRAEDSASNEAEREQVHQMRVSSEQERLNAAEQARRREREAAHLGDERAQQAEAARIRAAEEKANERTQAAAEDSKPGKVVPWDEVTPQRKMQGTLIRVDCIRDSARLWVKGKGGQVIQLFLKDPGQLSLSCGQQQQPRRVSIAYSARPDDHLKTSGDVVSIQFQ